MRYYFKEPEACTPQFGKVYICDHPVYSRCTLFEEDGKGLAVVQQRYNPRSKHTWWTSINPQYINPIYIHPKFREYFNKYAGKCINGVYPTVTIRQIMWALRMKPLRRELWETSFYNGPF